MQDITPVIPFLISEKSPLNPPISSEELRKMFMDSIQERPTIQIPTETEMRFENIYDFVAWYINHQNCFTQEQSVALASLVQTRDMIEVGCNCKRLTREAVANEYFKSFWVNNLKTDLLPTVLKATGVNKIHFGNFLNFP